MWNPYVKRSAYTSISHFDVTSIYEMLCICIHFTFLCDMYVWNALYIYTNHILTWYLYVKRSVLIYIQPIADRVTQNLEIISKNFESSTRRTRILIGFEFASCYYNLLIVATMGRILVCWQSFTYISQDSAPSYLQLAVENKCSIVYIYVYCNFEAILVY